MSDAPLTISTKWKGCEVWQSWDRMEDGLGRSCPPLALSRGSLGREDATTLFRSGDPALLRQRGPKARGRTGTGTGRTEVAQKSSKSAGVDAVDAVGLKNKLLSIGI
jgi:hypothetical protein